MKRTILAMLVLLFILLLPVKVSAATALFDTAVSKEEANGWTSVLYVNNVAFPLVHTCVDVSSGLVTCTAQIPPAAMGTPPFLQEGPQTFEVSFKTATGQESSRSLPVLLFLPSRPLPPAQLKVQ